MRWVSQRAPARSASALRYFVSARSPARSALAVALMAGVTLAISACGKDKSASLSERVIPLGQTAPKGGGRYHVGKPYKIAGLRYTPREDPAYDRKGTASWYGALFHGRYTANGEIYDMDRLSAAHPTLPLPVYAHVTNLRNGRSIVVRVNDRGPFKKDRIIDLSRRSAEVLGFKQRGTAPVRVRYLRRAPLSGEDSYERKYLAGRGYRHYASKASTPRDAAGQNPIAVASLDRDAPPPPPDRRPVTAAMPKLAAVSASGSLTMQELIAASEATGSIPTPARLAPPRVASLDGPAIQAGSFKNRGNAERARVTLAEIGPVDVTEVVIGGESYFRVRVGPFADEIEAAATLPLVTDAGYQGAKILLQN